MCFLGLTVGVVSFSLVAINGSRGYGCWKMKFSTLKSDVMPERVEIVSNSSLLDRNYTECLDALQRFLPYKISTL